MAKLRIFFYLHIQIVEKKRTGEHANNGHKQDSRQMEIPCICTV